MPEQVTDPRTEEQVRNDIVDRSPGFADLLHRYNLIGDYKGRTLTADEAQNLAREAYETGIFEHRHNPQEIESLDEEFVEELLNRH